MQLYLELAKKAFQRQMAYRAANIAGLVTNLFFGALRAAVMMAVFAYRDNVAGYDLTRAITFTGITQALIMPVQLWGWRFVADSIKSGAIVTDLAKPIDLYTFWQARDIGRAVYYLLFRGLPIVILYALVFPIYLPESGGQWALFLLSLTLALLLSFAWNFVVNLSAFWVMDAIGVIRMAGLVHMFLSGFLVPAAFFPPWLRLVSRLTPFPAIVNTPLEVYLGIAQGSQALQQLAEQAIWLLLMMGAGRLILTRGTHKLVIQGG